MTDIHGIARAALSADVEKVNTLSHNLSNINTNGYKRQVFSLNQGVEVTDGLISSGALKQKIQVDFEQGALKRTESPLNTAINGDGFYLVGDQSNPYLTRRGAFVVSADGYLSLPSGERVQGKGGDISVTSSDVSISSTGEVSEAGVLLDTLVLVEPENLDQLQYVGAGLFSAQQGYQQLNDIRVMPGFVETSNVNSLAEMTNLMLTVRHFESAAQVLRGYDDMLDAAINELTEF